MKDRLIEDWLTRINERGYESSFCQILLSQGYQILRCGHSPTEHGKDVLAISPDGAVCAYQLKSGDFSQADVGKHHAQLTMLVETRPIHPGLPASFEYRVFFVTTGEFKDPAVSLIRELRTPLEEIWLQLTDVAVAWFRPDAPEDSLLWRCEKGKEYSQSFARPQSWKELQAFVTQDDQERVPSVLRDDFSFALLFSLVFQHRTQLSLMKHLDNAFFKR